jgi:hypothetical protein
MWLTLERVKAIRWGAWGLSLGIFVLTSAWILVRGPSPIATLILILAVIGLAMQLVGSLLGRPFETRGNLHEAHLSVKTDADPDSMFQSAKEVLRELLTVDEGTDERNRSAWVRTPSTLRSWGERISVQVRGNSAEITSRYLRPTRSDHGENRANVELVADELTDRLRRPRSDDPAP